jgi:hypothetical protein
MNFQEDGVSDEVLKRKIRECGVDLWLLPTKAPFVTMSLYSHQNIYPADVLDEFRANFALQQSGKVFDQWRCNHARTG